ncbi:MAG: hypothetical protein KAJ15_11095, partial [Spirochaetes bacterium]|nr:hypothetical protein [Spirochaetota bacterium]
MKNLLHSYISEEDIAVFISFIHMAFKSGNKIYPGQFLLEQFYAFSGNSSEKKEGTGASLCKFIHKIQEAVRIENNVLIFYRPHTAKHSYLKFDLLNNSAEEISVSEYLGGKDRYILGNTDALSPLQIDLTPSHLYPPSIDNSKDIGKGLNVLMGHIEENLRHGSGKFKTLLFDFLKTRKINDRSILLNGVIINNSCLFLEKMDELLSILQEKKPDTQFESVRETMAEYGFEAGWGNNTG